MKTLREISKLIALVLRHKPEALGLSMDSHGWVDAAALIEKINAMQPFTMDMLREIVETDNKRRYAFDADQTRIRANQGHSIPVDLELQPVVPPDVLYHGTATRFSGSIEEKGLLAMQRQYVHLSDNIETATAVGMRHGTPVIYEVDAQAMHGAGYAFYRSENGVWLTDSVPAEYLRRMDKELVHRGGM